MDKPFKIANQFEEEDKRFSTWNYKYLGVGTLLRGTKFELSVLFAKSCNLLSVLCFVSAGISSSAIFFMASSLTSIKQNTGSF